VSGGYHEPMSTRERSALWHGTQTACSVRWSHWSCAEKMVNCEKAQRRNNCEKAQPLTHPRFDLHGCCSNSWPRDTWFVRRRWHCRHRLMYQPLTPSRRLVAWASDPPPPPALSSPPSSSNSGNLSLQLYSLYLLRASAYSLIWTRIKFGKDRTDWANENLIR